MEAIITTEVKNFDLEPSKADQLASVFNPFLEQLKEFEGEFNEITSIEVIDEDVAKKAKRLRLDIAKIRIDTDKAHKGAKAESLRLGKAIDGIRNIVRFAVVDKEEKLKAIETHIEKLEQERTEKLQAERMDRLSPFVSEDFDKPLTHMDDDVFEAYLTNAKTIHDKRVAEEKRIEDERIAKEKAEEEERARIRAENIKLKQEAEEKEKAAQIERKQREDREAKEKAERDAKEEKARKESEAIIKKEREAREKIEAELKAQKDAEIKAEADRIKAEKIEADRIAKEQAAPDVDKFKKWINEFSIPSLEVTDKDVKETKKVVEDKFEAFKKWAITQISNL